MTTWPQARWVHRVIELTKLEIQPDFEGRSDLVEWLDAEASEGWMLIAIYPDGRRYWGIFRAWEMLSD